MMMHMRNKHGGWRVVRFIPFAILMLVLVAALVMQLWNWLLPELFGLHAISLTQAFGLLVLSKILFGGWRGGGHRWFSHGGYGAWGKMTEEEREKIREKFRGRCWNGDEHVAKPNEDGARSPFKWKKEKSHYPLWCGFCRH